jgi:hypothetical protein
VGAGAGASATGSGAAAGLGGSVSLQAARAVAIRTARLALRMASFSLAENRFDCRPDAAVRARD